MAAAIPLSCVCFCARDQRAAANLPQVPKMQLVNELHVQHTQPQKSGSVSRSELNTPCTCRRSCETARKLVMLQAEAVL